MQLLIGQNLRDLFPTTVAELKGGLVITRMRVALQEPDKHFGFAGTCAKDGLVKPTKASVGIGETMLADATDTTGENEVETTEEVANFRVPASTLTTT